MKLERINMSARVNPRTNKVIHHREPAIDENPRRGEARKGEAREGKARQGEVR